MGSSTMRLGVVLLCVTAVLASEMTTQFDDGDTVVTDPASEAAATNDAAITPEQTEGGISQRLNQESGSETGAQVADATPPTTSTRPCSSPPLLQSSHWHATTGAKTISANLSGRTQPKGGRIGTRVYNSACRDATSSSNVKLERQNNEKR